MKASSSTIDAINERLAILGIDPVEGASDYDRAQREIADMGPASSTASKLDRQEVDIALRLVEHGEQHCGPRHAREAENQARNVMGLDPLSSR